MRKPVRIWPEFAASVIKINLPELMPDRLLDYGSQQDQAAELEGYVH